MNKNTILGLILAGLIVVGGLIYFAKNRSANQLRPELPQPPTPPPVPVTLPTPTPAETQGQATQTLPTPSAEATEVIVRITDQGFEPREVEVKKGTKVTWVNESSSLSWPASAVHPTHRVYPGSDIEKCGTGAEIFDACRGLRKGESWSFVFNEVGEWRYHDHLNPSKTGKVIVR